MRRRIQVLNMAERMEEVRDFTSMNGNEAAIEATERDAAAARLVAEQSAELGDPTVEQIHRWRLLESSRNRKRNVGSTKSLGHTRFGTFQRVGTPPARQIGFLDVIQKTERQYVGSWAQGATRRPTIHYARFSRSKHGRRRIWGK